LWQFVDNKKKMKLREVPIAMYMRAAVLLSNFNSCLYGNETSTFFDIAPPTLEEYCVRRS
jgi:hypothetical protein